MIGCRPRPRLGGWNLVRLACHCLLSNADCHETCWAGSCMWTGLTVARDLQPGSCCQREMLWCGSQLWIVYWSRLVLCRTLRLNFLRDVDDSGLFVRRSLHVLRVVCDFLLAPSIGAVGKGFFHGPSKLRCEILLPSSLRLCPQIYLGLHIASCSSSRLHCHGLSAFRNPGLCCEVCCTPCGFAWPLRLNFCLMLLFVPRVTLLHHPNLVCFIDVILDFIFSLILYRCLHKFLLLRCKLGAGVLPTAIVFCSATATVVAWETPLQICLHHHSLLICFTLPTLFESSQSPLVLSMREGLGDDFASASAFASASVFAVGSAFGPLATNSRSCQSPFFSMATALLSPCLRPFARLFINLTMCEWALFPKPTTTLGLVEQAFRRMPSFTGWVIASSFKVILARQSRQSSTGTLASGTSGFRRISHALLRGRSRRRIRLCWFCTLIHIVSDTAIVSFRTLPVSFPLPTIS